MLHRTGPKRFTFGRYWRRLDSWSRYRFESCISDGQGEVDNQIFGGRCPPLARCTFHPPRERWFQWEVKLYPSEIVDVAYGAK